MLIGWNESFSVGVEFIDSEHKTLIQIADELHEAMCERKGKQHLGEVLARFASYTKTHIAHEEQTVRQYRYPGEAQHKTQHADLIAEVTKLQTRHAAGEVTLTVEVFTFLQTWLARHIQGSDKQLGDWLNTPRETTPAAPAAPQPTSRR